jgi:hypothetical protein
MNDEQIRQALLNAAENARILALLSTPETVQAVAAAVGWADYVSTLGEEPDGPYTPLPPHYEQARAALATVRALIQQTGDTA